MIDAARRKGAERAITEPPPPTPPFPAEPPKPGDRETVPVEPIKLPDRTEFPAEAPKLPNIMIFQSLENDAFWREVMILRRWGDEKTKELNDRAGKLGVEIGKQLGRKLTMTHGGFTKGGKYQSELHLPPKGELMDPDRPLANGSWPDVVLVDEDTQAKILINTADTYAGTGVPQPREERQEEKIMINKESNDIFIALPKPRGKVDLKDYVKQFEPLLEEAINRLNSEP